MPEFLVIYNVIKLDGHTNEYPLKRTVSAVGLCFEVGDAVVGEDVTSKAKRLTVKT